MGEATGRERLIGALGLTDWVQLGLVTLGPCLWLTRRRGVKIPDDDFATIALEPHEIEIQSLRNYTICPRS